MHTIRPMAVLGVLAALGSAARAETYHLWVDADGSTHLTIREPAPGVRFKRVELPDPVSWAHPPEMPGEVGGPEAPQKSPQRLFETISQSVYALSGQVSKRSGPERKVVVGSAVAITKKLALTNCHVIAAAGDEIYLGAGGTTVPERVKLVGADYPADRCVVEVKYMDLQPVPGVRGFDALEVGEAVFAVGNPMRLQRTFSEGLLSGKRALNEQRYLQTSAAISPGSSGGGLFDSHGNLIGITSFTLKDAQSLNFAISAEDFWK